MKKLISLFVMAAMVEFIFVGVSKAADPNRPQRPHFDPNSIRGRVLVDKDANGVVTAVKLENRRRGNWNIVLDANGMKLAEMANKIVILTGKEEIKDGKKWLTVETIQELKRPERPRNFDPNQIRRRPGGSGGQK